METPEDVQYKQRIVGIFERASATYDRVGSRFFSYFGHQLVRFAGVPAGARVLDVACGKGAVLIPAAQAVGVQGSVVGIDLGENMVQACREELDQHPLSNAEVRQMDAEALQFADGSFDFVLCGFSIFFFPRLERAIAEFRRVLRPGGKLAFSTWDELYSGEWAWYPKLVEAFLGPPPTAQTNDNPVPRPVFDTPEGLTAIIHQGGFGDAKISTDAFDCHYKDETEWWESLWSHAGRNLLERIQRLQGPEALERFQAEAFEQLKALRQAAGYRQTFPAFFTLATRP